MHEIERKFLIDEMLIPKTFAKSTLEQCYLALEPEIRIRIEEDESGCAKATLTLKGKGDIKRIEIEASLLANEARAFFAQAIGKVIRKERSKWFDDRGLVWEIDRYLDDLEGLWVAEVELTSESDEVSLPEFVKREITTFKEFKNLKLATEHKTLDVLLDLVK